MRIAFLSNTYSLDVKLPLVLWEVLMMMMMMFTDTKKLQREGVTKNLYSERFHIDQQKRRKNKKNINDKKK
jgi:hypothetical protein